MYPLSVLVVYLTTLHVHNIAPDTQTGLENEIEALQTREACAWSL